MKKHVRFTALLLLGLTMQITAQQLNQVIVVSGGIYSNPDDFVTTWSLAPEEANLFQFDEVRTHSTQSALVHDDHLYVAAMDSLVMYDLNTLERLAITAVEGVNFMAVYNNWLFVSRQFPAEAHFVQVFNRNTLDFSHNISQISDESAGMRIMGDKVYVAVPGSWMSTQGRLAILDAETAQFEEEIALGESAMGIHSLYPYNGFLLSVNKSAWDSNTGTLSLINTEDKTYSHFDFNHAIGYGIAVDGDLLYCLLDEGIGSINLSTMEVATHAIVPDPGSSAFVYFAAVAFDSLSNHFYATTTDYVTFGQGYKYNLEGELINTFDIGVSAEAIAFDYRDATTLFAHHAAADLKLFPNPASNLLHLSIARQTGLWHYTLSDLNGRSLKQGSLDTHHRSIDISAFRSGIYLIEVQDAHGQKYRQKFIKL